MARTSIVLFRHDGEYIEPIAVLDGTEFSFHWRNEERYSAVRWTWLPSFYDEAARMTNPWEDTL